MKWWSASSAAALATVAGYLATHGFGLGDGLPWLAAAGLGLLVLGVSLWVALRVIPVTNRRGWRGQLVIAELIGIGAIGWGMAVLGLIRGESVLVGWGIGLGILCSTAVTFYYRWIMRGRREARDLW
jgi:hypothetical protein